MMMVTHPDFFSRLHSAIRRAPAGFAYGFASPLFKEEAYMQLMADFPNTARFRLVDKQSGGGHKRFYVGPRYTSAEHQGCICHLRSLSPVWRAVLDEVSSPSYMHALRDATGIAFNSLANFGFAYGNEGCVQEPHIDGAVRSDPASIRSTIACLIYCNAGTGGIGGTQVHAPDRHAVLFSVPDLRNSFFFFEQHADAWHGFPMMPRGADRRLISLAYSSEARPLLLKRSLWHRMTCFKKYGGN